MKYSEIAVLSALVASTAARPALHSSPSSRLHARDMKLSRREVPQEQSHKPILVKTQEMLLLNNPDEIVDSVFGLLGNAAAEEGIGSIADADCLQQATADQAFTNAVAAGDLEGQIAALTFRTLERNTVQVGLKSVDCTVIQAVNPQIAALSQHQDPASEDAAAINKAIALELARQLAAIGADPLLALQGGTFAPGEIGDPTAAGNTCNDEDDAEGCIFSQGLLVADASEEEILAAVADVQVGEVVAAEDLVEVDDAAAVANVTGVDQAELDAAKQAELDLLAQQEIDAAAEAEKAKQEAELLKQKNQDKDDDKNDDKNKDDKKDNEDDKLRADEYNKEILRQKNFDIIIVIQIAAQHILEAQANAWRVIALKQQELEQQFLQQAINQQLFQQQFFQFQQHAVNNFAFAANQHIGILEHNQNVLNLGGFNAVKGQFQQQLNIQDIEKLLGVGKVGKGRGGLAKLLA